MMMQGSKGQTIPTMSIHWSTAPEKNIGMHVIAVVEFYYILCILMTSDRFCSTRKLPNYVNRDGELFKRLDMQMKPEAPGLLKRHQFYWSFKLGAGTSRLARSISYNQSLCPIARHSVVDIGVWISMHFLPALAYESSGRTWLHPLQYRRYRRPSKVILTELF